MAAYISFQPSDFFNTVLYTGTGTSTTFTGVGFQGDFWWGKQWEHTRENRLFDSVRGAGYYLSSNSTAAQSAEDTDTLSAWTADGFTLGSDNVSNVNTGKFVSWNWKMGTTSGLTGGTITPSSYSISATAGQSIIGYTGTMALATVPHGLGKAPKLIICKQYNTSRHWNSYWSGIGATKYIAFDSTAAQTSSTRWNDTEPDATVFTVKNQDETNGTGTMVAYCFTDIKGYSSIGSYTGNNNTDGTFVYCGFSPAYVIIKNSESTDVMVVCDNKRAGYNDDNRPISPYNTSAEETGDYGVRLVSNGFKCIKNNGKTNGDGNKMLYAAFAEFPIVSSNSKAGTAR